ncbi:MAG TPA: rhomboid family intramembrane serine protease [Nitrososphaeraceae archaeon]|nr:rhomboid family intramembrane serine protease [Nitrososphaeraceae archaeon]
MFPIHDDTDRIHGRPYVNYTLIVINAIVFIWEVKVTGFFTNEQAVAEIFSNYGVIPRFLLAGDLVSVITSMFIHGSIAHIAGNMVFLFVFGDNIEDRFGRIKYLLAYILWGLLAAFVHSIYAINSGSGEIPAVGASGAISGVLGAYLIMFPRAKIFTVIVAFFITSVRIPALAFIPFWFILQIVFAVMGSSGGGIAYLAHIGGFAIGVGSGYIWKLLLGHNTVGRLQPVVKSKAIRKERPSIEDAAPQISPELIEGPDFYEIIAEIRGVTNSSNIQANYEPESGNIRIIALGSRKYDMLVKLPDTALNPTVKYIHYLNGIARIRITK